jgi:CRP-like cAMP-binding protein
LTGSSPPRTHRLADVPLFSAIETRVLDELAAICRVRHFPQGQVICYEGDPGDSLIVLEEGRLRISRVTPAGREIVLAVIDAPAAVGELSLLDGGPRDATIIAQRAVSVRLLPRDEFQQLLARDPTFVDGLLITLVRGVRYGNLRHEDIVGLDVTGRVAQWLLRQARALGIREEPGMIVSLGRSQGELAAELSMTRTSLNKTLMRLEALGLLRVDGDAVALYKPAALLDFLS